MSATHWIFQEHGGKPVRVNIAAGQDADAALAAHFREHEEFRNEGSGDIRPLREFLPEVTPAVLELFDCGKKLWTSEEPDLQQQLVKALREALDAARYHAQPLNPKNKAPRAEWMLDAEALLKRAAS